MKTFASWFLEKGFRHFSPSEIEGYFDEVRKGVRNSAPDPELWENIVPTLRVLDDLREKIGGPIIVTSSYRSPEYNRAVGGKSASQHMLFRAIDFQTPKTPLWRAELALRKMRDEGKFKGGIGAYPTFIHVDTRGHNADW